MICSSLSTSATGPHARRVSRRGGSTLVWVMVVVLVLVIVLGVGLAAASGRFSLSSTRHKQQQAYYTALSSTQTIADWLVSGDDSDGLTALFTQLDSAGDATLTLVEDGLPAGVGSCVVELSYVEEGTLKISSTATFADASETISLTLTQSGGGSPGLHEGELKTTDFPTTVYDARAAALNAVTTTGVVPLFDASSSSDNSGFNATDLTKLNTYISAGSSIEARWTNVKLDTSSSTDRYNDYDAVILGTQRYPLPKGGTTTDTRRFMVPANGRILIDPLEYSGGNANTATSGNNTKLVSLAIDNTKDKDVLFRLATGASSITGDDPSTAKNGVNGKLYVSSSTHYNSLLMLDFTDNAGNTEKLSYTIDGTTREHTWHPDNWNKLDIFVQSSSPVNANILFGPFGHKYDDGFDFESKGNFVDNWNGTKGEYKTLWPYVKAANSEALGLPEFPVYFGDNAGLWILDGNKDRYFRLMQGTNVIRGTIYSTRPTIIGGGLMASAVSHTSDYVNSDRDGFANKDPDTYTNYIDATLRYDQLIYDTDIVLKAPSSGTAQSVIRRPDTWEDRFYGTSGSYKVADIDKTFEPTLTITGGTIYVGSGQSLTIQGTEISQETKKALDNMWISPDKIVVDGGTLIIEKSETINIFTDIYVYNNGLLTIKTDAKIKGNIYAYNGGAVDVQGGGFLLESPHSEADEQEYDGIIVYGVDMIGTNGITAPGVIMAETSLVGFQNSDNPEKALAAGKVHLVGGDWYSLVMGGMSSINLSSDFVKRFLCSDYDPATGRCLHYNTSGSGTGGGGSGSGGGGSGGGWIIGSFGDG